MELTLETISVAILPLLLAVTLHEAAHGYVAKLCGDDTASRLGRVSLNPLRHIDPVGTILLPILGLLTVGFFFGWAKPVPVNFQALNHPRRDSVLVAAAGPATNILLAVLSILLDRVVALLPDSAVQRWVAEALGLSIAFNLVLAVINMLPVPPLDGGRVAVGLLPLPLARQWAKLERFGIPLMLGLLLLLPAIGEALGVDLDLVRPAVLGAVDWLEQALFWLFGGGD